MSISTTKRATCAFIIHGSRRRFRGRQKSERNARIISNENGQASEAGLGILSRRLDDRYLRSHISPVDRLSKLDSSSPAIRAIERWKRGLTALVILGVLLIASALIAGLVGWGISFLGTDEVLAGAITFIIIAPWMLGNRHSLRIVGNLATVADC